MEFAVLTGAGVHARTSAGVLAHTGTSVHARTGAGVLARTGTSVHARTGAGVLACTGTSVHARTGAGVLAHTGCPCGILCEVQRDHTHAGHCRHKWRVRLCSTVLWLYSYSYRQSDYNGYR